MYKYLLILETFSSSSKTRELIILALNVKSFENCENCENVKMFTAK